MSQDRSHIARLARSVLSAESSHVIDGFVFDSAADELSRSGKSGLDGIQCVLKSATADARAAQASDQFRGLEKLVSIFLQLCCEHDQERGLHWMVSLNKSLRPVNLMAMRQFCLYKTLPSSWRKFLKQLATEGGDEADHAAELLDLEASNVQTILKNLMNGD